MLTPTVGTCRSCGASVFFAKSDAGKWMPFDCKPVNGYIIRDDEGTLRAIHQPTHISHFATCPQAETWRGGRRDVE